MKNNEHGLTPFQPDRGFLTLRDAMNQLFDESFWSPLERGAFTRLQTAMSGFPKVDISDTEKEIIVHANVPGLRPEDISVDVSDGVLTISGEVTKEHKDEDKDRHFYRYEREFGSFSRSFSLPAKVDESKIEAESKNGVLTITLPKSTEEQRKKIEIKVK